MAACTFTPEFSTRRDQRPTNASANLLGLSASSGAGKEAGEAEQSAGSSWSSYCPSSEGGLEKQRNHGHPSNKEHGASGGANERVQVEEEEEPWVGRGREATGGGLERRRDLPDGWSAFVAPEGRAYYFYAPTGSVQWERPVS